MISDKSSKILRIKLPLSLCKARYSYFLAIKSSLHNHTRYTPNLTLQIEMKL